MKPSNYVHKNRGQIKQSAERLLLDSILAREDITDDEFDVTCADLKALINDGKVSLNNPNIGDWIRENKKRLVESLPRRQRKIYRRRKCSL